MKNEYKRSKPKIFQNSVYEKKTPRAVSPPPTQEDYERGFMVRYFLKRKRPKGRVPIEVDRNQYNEWSLRGRGISRQDYDAIVVKWRISGSVDPKVNDSGYPVSRGVRLVNKRLLENVYEPQMSGISDVLSKNLLQYCNNNNEDRRNTESN